MGLQSLPMETKFIGFSKDCGVTKVKKLVDRPDFGQSGSIIQLISNHFPLNFDTCTIFHYDVQVEAITARVAAIGDGRDQPFGINRRLSAGEKAQKRFRKLDYK